jgi:hypothetical protein
MGFAERLDILGEGRIHRDNAVHQLLGPANLEEASHVGGVRGVE